MTTIADLAEHARAAGWDITTRSSRGLAARKVQTRVRVTLADDGTPSAVTTRGGLPVTTATGYREVEAVLWAPTQTARPTR